MKFSPLNRCQLTGTLIQAAKQIVECQEVVVFELSFGGNSSVARCVARHFHLQKQLLNTAEGKELTVSGRLDVDRDGHLYVLAFRIESPEMVQKRLEQQKARIVKENAHVQSHDTTTV